MSCRKTVNYLLCFCTECLHAEYARICKSVASTTSACTTDSQEVQDQAATKKARTSLFGHYKKASSGSESDRQRSERCLAQYLDAINADDFIAGSSVFTCDFYANLSTLFSRVFCVPASSAPVERVFSQSGLIMRPHRSRMSDSLLETLVFLKCNSAL